MTEKFKLLCRKLHILRCLALLIGYEPEYDRLQAEYKQVEQQIIELEKEEYVSLSCCKVS